MSSHAVLALVLCFSLASVWGDVPPSMSFHCQEVNAAVDQAIQAVNEAHKKDEHSVSSWQQDVHLRFFGIKVPVMPVSFNTSKGLLKSFDTLARSDNASSCSNPIFRTLDGVFKLGPLEMTFDSTKAKFLFMEAEGELAHKVQVSMDVIVAQGTIDCRLESFKVTNFDNAEFDFSAGSWKGWIVGKALQNALRGASSTPMESYIAETASYIANAFSEAWCKTLKPLEA